MVNVMIYVLSALAGFAYGCVFCLMNHKVLMHAVNKVDPSKEQQKAATEVMKAYIFRCLVSFVALILVIFICKALPLHFITTIIAAAVGITVPGQIWHIRNDKPKVNLSGNSVISAFKKEEKKTDGDEWESWDSWDDDWDDDDWDRKSEKKSPEQAEPKED